MSPMTTDRATRLLLPVIRSEPRLRMGPEDADADGAIPVVTWHAWRRVQLALDHDHRASPPDPRVALVVWEIQSCSRRLWRRLHLPTLPATKPASGACHMRCKQQRPAQFEQRHQLSTQLWITNWTIASSSPTTNGAKPVVILVDLADASLDVVQRREDVCPSNIPRMDEVFVTYAG
ncbi:hypothetical protein FRC09_004594 [Ceratobasidium sp. 395]|nr:hypothetical protein FRC09_004594 [Ceratobasidium sp. 395]